MQTYATASPSYEERGGLRWGKTYWRAANATWPFAKITVSTNAITIRLTSGIANRVFAFSKSEITSLRKTRGFFSTGLDIRHTNRQCPQFIVFWTIRFHILKMQLEQRGYTVASARSG